MPVNPMTVTNPIPKGESPSQAQKINKGSSTANPKSTATNPRRSQRLVATPPSKDTARAVRERTQTFNRQSIGSQRNNVKKTSRKRIATLIRIQKEINTATPQPNSSQQTTAKTRPAEAREPQFTYHFINPKGKPAPATITQDKEEEEREAAAAAETSLQRCNGKTYGKTNISPPLAGISRGALHQFMGNTFLEELKKNTN